MKVLKSVKTKRVVLVERPSLKVAQIKDDKVRAIARMACAALVRVS